MMKLIFKPKTSNSNLSPSFIAFLLISAFFLLSYLSMLGKSATFDEVRNYNYGKSILAGDSNRPGDRSILDDAPIAGSMMPVSVLNALPIFFGSFLPESSGKVFLESGATARSITILFSILTAWLVYYWTRSLYGATPALFSLTFYVFDPNIIAHSQYITTDMYAWSTTLLVFFCTWKFAKHRNWQNGFIWAVALAISSLAKYTTIVLIPLSLLAIFIHDFRALTLIYQENRIIAIQKILARFTSYLLMAVVTSLIAINIGFVFNRTWMLFEDYTFYSHLLQSIQQNLPWLGKLPMPVPYPYLQGFDLTYYYGEAGRAFGNIYLLGQLRDGTDGFNGYYFVASLFKTPIAIQLFIAVTFYLYIRQKEYTKRFLSDEIFLLLPILFFILYFNLFFNINTGIRYYLVFFPLLYVFCGRLFIGWQDLSKSHKTISIFLLCYLCVSVLSYFPNYVPYFNELLIDRRMAYKILADSNIDYGQGENALDDFRSAHPQAIYNPVKPTAGLIVVNVNDLTGVFGKPQDFSWLRDSFEPDRTIQYTYLIYDISTQELEALCQKTSFCK